MKGCVPQGRAGVLWHCRVWQGTWQNRWVLYATVSVTEQHVQQCEQKVGYIQQQSSGGRRQKIVSSFPSRSRHRPRHKSKGTRLSRKKHKQSHTLDIQEYKEKGHFPKRFSMFRSEFGSYFRLNFFSSLIAVFADFRWWFLLLSMIAVCEVTSCE